MGKPPYDDPDPLDRMRSDAGFALGAVTHDGPEVPTVDQGLHGLPTEGFEVPSDVVALGELHFHLD